MTDMPALPGYYTPEEAADVIGVSPSMITRYIQDGLLKATRVGRQIFIEQHVAHCFERPPRGNPNFRRTEELETGKK